MNNIKVIAFDADDTLWVNEPHYRAAENKFSVLLKDYLPTDSVYKELFKTEMKNLGQYGFGAKGFMLSMIETAINISEKKLDNTVIEKIIDIGREVIEMPVDLLDNVEYVLQQLQGKYRLVVATKGDLLDQEKKLKKSGLEKYFHHIEVMSDKTETEYIKLIKHLDIQPQEFLMVGNSVKSDILPVLQVGGHAFHIPFHTEWEYEKVNAAVEHNCFKELKCIEDVLDLCALQETI